MTSKADGKTRPPWNIGSCAVELPNPRAVNRPVLFWIDLCGKACKPTMCAPV